MLNDKLSGHFEIFKKSCGIYIVAFCITAIVAKGFDYVCQLYYLIVPILFCVILSELISKSKLKRKYPVTIYFMPFVICILLSSIWSIHPEITLKRSLYFLFLVIGMESLSDFYQKGTGSIAKVFMPAIVIVVSISIFSFIVKIPADYWNGGNGLGLKGFAKHQNTLSSILLICLSIMNLKLAEGFKLRKDPARLLAMIIFGNLATLIILLLTFSRGAILSYLVFLFSFMILFVGFNKTIQITFIGAIIFFILLCFPSIKKYKDYSLTKGAPSVFSSRSELYKISFNAALDGWRIGVGYGMSNPKYVDNSFTCWIDSACFREKGSTILALVEEVGFVGAILFYIPIIIVLYRIARRPIFRHLPGPICETRVSNGISRQTWGTGKESEDAATAFSLTEKDKTEAKFLFAVLIAMIVHSQFEAWGTGVGSLSLPIFLFFLSKGKKVTGVGM